MQRKKKKSSNLQFAMAVVTVRSKKNIPHKSKLGKAVLFAMVKIIRTSNVAGAFRRVKETARCLQTCL